MKHFSLVLALLFVFTAVLNGQTQVQETEEEENELNVTAERMEVQIDGKTIELTNNVRFEDDSMVLTADRMTIFLDNEQRKPEDSKKKQADAAKKDASDEKTETLIDDTANLKLKRIEAVGKVELRSKADATQSAAGNSAVYDVSTDSVTLSGECVITQGDRTMKGNEVVFDRTNNKIFVKNADIRIRLKKNSKDKGFGNFIGGRKDGKGKEKAEEKAKEKTAGKDVEKSEEKDEKKDESQAKTEGDAE
ncbi:MAG: hypothetical protein J6X55_06130 [Victivallales bacterium]|nr:hypothetical protein [Victivallales bacterium]